MAGTVVNRGGGACHAAAAGAQCVRGRAAPVRIFPEPESPMSEAEHPPVEPDTTVEQQRLRRTVAEYEERLDEFAALAARVRHEINNPLTGLIGQAQLLLREELSATARRRVQTIEQLALRIRDTVAELRSVQRASPEDGARDHEPPPRH